MKKLLIIFISLLFTGVVYSQDDQSMDIFIKALIEVESRGDTFAIGDGGKAVGILQIHPIMVREVNRILEKEGVQEVYTYNDRYDYDKSVEMFLIWYDYYHKYASYERIARCWNGGPRGDTYHCTKPYWYKVSYYMNQLAWTE